MEQINNPEDPKKQKIQQFLEQFNLPDELNTNEIYIINTLYPILQAQEVGNNILNSNLPKEITITKDQIIKIILNYPRIQIPENINLNLNDFNVINDYLTNNFGLPSDISKALASLIARNKDQKTTTSTPQIEIPQTQELNDQEQKDKIKNYLLTDPKFIHIYADSVSDTGGSGIKNIYKNGENIPSTNTTKIKELNLDDLNIPDLRHGLSKKIQNLIKSNTNFLDAYPYIQKFSKGTGYGIIIKIMEGTRNGACAYFVIIPEEKFNTVNFIKEHPETLLEIFKQEFLKNNISSWLNLQQNKYFLSQEYRDGQGVLLAEKKFNTAEN